LEIPRSTDSGYGKRRCHRAAARCLCAKQTPQRQRVPEV
jgi:hypothetical protein